MNRWMDEEWTGRWMDEDRWIDGWAGGKMDGWVDGWEDRWMDEWYMVVWAEWMVGRVNKDVGG